MFEAARKMKGGVAHVKDLDMSVLKRRDTLKKDAGTCSITTIDLVSGEVKTTQKKVRAESMRFDFNSKDNFNPENDSIKVAKEAWDWVLNPIGFDNFTKSIKDKQVMIVQNRDGLTLEQDDPEDDLVSYDILKTVIKQSTQMYAQSKDEEQSM